MTFGITLGLNGSNGYATNTFQHKSGNGLNTGAKDMDKSIFGSKEVAYFDANKLNKIKNPEASASAFTAYISSPPAPSGCGSKLDLQAC